MEGDRRAAPRRPAPEDVEADVSGVVVRLVELSLAGAKVEHRARFTLSNPQLTLKWRKSETTLPVRAARSEIVGRDAAELIYHTGLFFLGLDSRAESVLASMLQDPAPPPEAVIPQAATEPKSMDDTWTRQIQLMRHEPDDQLPYAQFRLTPTGWQKDYAALPEQPADGFAISRDRHDFDELQRAFEAADPDTRRMMQVALESQLVKTK